MRFIYIIFMAISSSFYITGTQVPFWIKYVLMSMWIVISLLPGIIKKKKIEGIEYFCLKTYLGPIIFIITISFMSWLIERPSGFSMAYVTRMFSNCFNIILAIVSAIAAVKVFGKKAIKYTVIAIALSIFYNMICCIRMYGMGLFLQYIRQAIYSTDFQYGSALYNLGLALEVQDTTLATGFYILYFIFFDNENKKSNRFKYIIILLLCAYIGFKRTEFISIVIVSIFLILTKKFKPKNVIFITGTIMGIISFLYVLIVKMDMFSEVVDFIGADVTGRVNVYSWLSNYYDMSLLYIGKGFAFVDKSMYETTGFACHNVVIRMYAELGCIPFIVWLCWYLIKIPMNILKRFDEKCGTVAFSCILYLFLTYFIGNSINFFCIQFSFILIQLLLIFPEKKNIENVKGEDYENSNFINAKSL